MIELKINDQIVKVNEKSTLYDLLHTHGYQNGCYAVALNRCFIPREDHRNIFLNENDMIEIITPMPGG